MQQLPFGIKPYPATTTLALNSLLFSILSCHHFPHHHQHPAH